MDILMMVVNRIYEIYTSKESTDTFDVGRIISKSEKGVLFYSYPVGDEQPQIQYVNIDCIYRIAENTAYIDNIETEDIKINEYSELANSSDLKKGLFSYCKANGLKVEVELYNSDHIDAFGRVSEIDNEKVVISQLTDDNELDGETEIVLESVTRIATTITKKND